MKLIGMLGGMSWQSTQTYYRLLNESVKERLGGLSSAHIALVSVDFAPLEELQISGQWGEIGEILALEARRTELAGADFLMVCTNTMHKVADQIESAIDIPLLHIADASAKTLVASGVKTVGLLGTAFTMEQAFYKDRLAAHGIDVLIPDQKDRAVVHRIIYEELCKGDIRPTSRDIYLQVINRLVTQGAEGILLACTEIGLLVEQGLTNVPLFDTAEIHALEAVTLSLGD